MRKQYLAIISALLVFVCMVTFTSCAKPVEDHNITFDEMSFTLPDGNWDDISDDDSDGKTFRADGYELEVGKTEGELPYFVDSQGASNYQFWSGYVYDDWPEGTLEPYGRLVYVDGYRAELLKTGDAEIFMIEKSSAFEYDSVGEYYYIAAVNIEMESLAEEELIEIAQSIVFDEHGSVDADKDRRFAAHRAGLMEDIASEGSEAQISAQVEGVVMSISQEKDSNGKPTYIDIGAAYPDSNRITAIVWEEDYDKISSYLGGIENLEGKRIILQGDFFIYQGVLNTKLDRRPQIAIIQDVMDL